MHLFFTPDIDTAAKAYMLSEDESKHCIRVLRLKNGDNIVLIDGRGGKYRAVIADDHAKRCVVTITQCELEQRRAPFYLHLAIAPTKNNDRLEWFVEKATEIGIDEISLIDCAHNERSTVKTERIEKVAISAIKQSLKAHLPKVNELLSFEQFLKHTSNFTGQKFIAHCNEALLQKQHLNRLYKKQSDALVLIGPEGDFSVEEVKKALSQGFQEISLGSSRLRTETAALYAVAALNMANE
jgi:16S rRNA (uracil1498-N3)-methyltransferase